MKEMQIQFSGIGKVDFTSFDLPVPERLGWDELLLRTEYTLISPGTEMDCLMDRAGGHAYPKVLGYSAVARVEDRGEGAMEFEVGDRVLVYHSAHRSRLLKKKQDVVKVSDGLDPREAIFAVVGCMGCQGVRKVRPELGEAFLVAGLGLLGLIASRCAVLSGAFPLIVTDFNEKRRAIARSYGADYAFSPDEPGLFEKVHGLTRGGKGVACAVEVTGSPQALLEVLKMTAPFGRVALVGCSRTPTKEIDFYTYVHRPCIQLLGGSNLVRPACDSHPGCWTMRDDMTVLMDLMLAKKLDVRPLLSVVEKPENAVSVYDRFISRDPDMLGAVFDWNGVTA